MQRRLSSSEKGKAIALEHVPAPRKARIRAIAPDLNSLKEKHSLTLIGRVTNPSVQKVWSLIPFFTDHWKTDIPPVGADLGLGMFQFQFELESDLLTVLEKQPYHYAKWMIILQRWEPTISPDFPSMIPFWIKVQGLPIHLGSEETIRSIGEDLGTWEATDITSNPARVRVHVNGRLPIIKRTVIEYDNGGEVIATLHYEKLEKHCSQCSKLDHELRDCLEAKALKKASMANQETKHRTLDIGFPENPKKESEARVAEHRSCDDVSRPPQRRITSGYSSHSLAYEGSQRRENHRGKTLRERGAHGQEWHPVRSLTPHNPTQSREIDYHRDREMARRASYQFRGDSHLYRSSKNKSRHSYQSCEEGRRVPSARRSPTPQEASANSHHKTQPYERGIPLPMSSTNLPIVAVENAVGVIRETLSQYTACADPSESAARRERVRLAEAQGTIEGNAIHLAKINEERMLTEEVNGGDKGSGSKTPVLARLGALTQENGLLDNRNSTGTSRDRAHVRERLGPYLPEMTISPTRHSDRPSPQSQKTPGSNSIERIPIASRLGPVSTEVRFEDVEFQTDPGSQRDSLPAKDRIGKALASPLSAAAGKKRKPGRPPGPRKVVSSPVPNLPSGSRKRKLHVEKPPTGRKKQNSDGERPRKTVKQSMQKGKNIRKGASTGTPSSSDNVPIVNMIPPSARRRMDFRVPSHPVP